MELVLGLEPWIGYSIIAVLLTYFLSAAGWVLARAGRSPVWVMAMLIPWVNIVAIWAFAYARWPAEEEAARAADEQGAAPRDGRVGD